MISYHSFLSLSLSGAWRRIGEEVSYRDVQRLGPSDESCELMADLLDWKEDLVYLFSQNSRTRLRGG